MNPSLVEQHGLTPAEYGKILAILGREPNLVELGIFSVMWSEHCSYKSSKVYLKKLPTRGRQVVCGPGENAGIVDIGDGLVVVFKMESHNHPSTIEPYQGAATGVGGILRDVFTMGARPIALLNSLRFGAPSLPLTPHLVSGVVAGIGGYGNCMGIPTVGGEVSFDECYNGNILVNAMCVGVAPKNRIFYAKAAGVGNPVIYVGSKTGRDGIHGATMASDVFRNGGNAAPSASGGRGPHPPVPLSLEPAKPDSRSQSDIDLKRPTVQVGDPFTEKLLMEACLELMRGQSVVGIQDMGAAGLTCSSLEMSGKGGVGMELDLSKVPRREAGMTPYEIMLSESQERMFLVGRRGSEKKILKLFQKWDLDAAVIGKVVRGNQVFIRNNGTIEGVLPTLPITENAPVYRRRVKRPGYLEEARRWDPATLHAPIDPAPTLKKLLASPNLASKKWVYRQYDQTVGTNTVVLPGSDAAVVRIKDQHTEGKSTGKGLAMTADCNSRYCYLDPRRGAMIAVAEAARNIVCSGGWPLAVTDCLNFGSPENPEVMWQFREALRGMGEACRAFGTPIVSGNVSFYNESVLSGGIAAPSRLTAGRGPQSALPVPSGHPSRQAGGFPPEPLSLEPAKPDSRSPKPMTTAIYPTPTIGMIGLLEDVEKHCTQWFKEEGDVVALLGPPNSSPADLGGSEYLKVVCGRVAGRPPRLNVKLEKAVQSACLAGIRRGWLRSAHDCSEGGLAVALAECCVSGPEAIGATLRPHPLPLSLLRRGVPEGRGEVFLFAETQSRILVTVRESDLQPFLKLAKVKRCPATPIGRVGGRRFRIGDLIDLPVDELKEVWANAFEKVIGGAGN